MLPPADLAFRVLVMLSGRSPNLPDKTKAAQRRDRGAGGPAGAAWRPYLIWLDASGRMLWASWELNVLLLGVNWFSEPVTSPKRTCGTRWDTVTGCVLRGTVSRKPAPVSHRSLLWGHPVGACSLVCVNTAKLHITACRSESESQLALICSFLTDKTLTVLTHN